MTAGDQPGTPSMDAILASIKRIIAEEADVMPVQPLRRVGNPPVPDVLDLTEEAGEAEALVSPVAAATSRAQLEARTGARNAPPDACRMARCQTAGDGRAPRRGRDRTDYRAQLALTRSPR